MRTADAGADADAHADVLMFTWEDRVDPLQMAAGGRNSS